MARHSVPERKRIEIARLLWLQGASVIMAVVAGAGWAGFHAATSAVKGGLVGLIPSLYFAWRIGSVRGGRQASRFVSNLYRAVAGKLGLTVALMAIVLVTSLPSITIFFFIEYFALILELWILLWARRKH